MKEVAWWILTTLFSIRKGTTAPDWNLFPPLGAEHIRGMVQAGSKVVLVAGRYKLTALGGALKGELLNVLITDEVAAKELLDSD
jgi:putative sugar-binding domain-containing protein